MHLCKEGDRVRLTRTDRTGTVTYPFGCSEVDCTHNWCVLVEWDDSTRREFVEAGDLKLVGEEPEGLRRASP